MTIVTIDIGDAELVGRLVALALSLDARSLDPDRRAASGFLTLPDTFGPEMLRQMASLPSVAAIDSEGCVVGFMLASEPDPAVPAPVVQGLLATFRQSAHAHRRCSMYGPIGVAARQQGRGLAIAMFDKLSSQVRAAGREVLLGFVDLANGPSLGLHLNKLAFEDIGHFKVGDKSYAAIMATL